MQSASFVGSIAVLAALLIAAPAADARSDLAAIETPSAQGGAACQSGCGARPQLAAVVNRNTGDIVGSPGYEPPKKSVKKLQIKAPKVKPAKRR